MSWEKYHNEVTPILLGEHAFAYKRAMQGISAMNARITDPNINLTMVLGGFHNAWTAADFKRFADEIHTGPHNTILLDMNQKPLTSVDSRVFPYKIQAGLEAVPLKPGSIDILLLDFTLQFMNDHQVNTFAQDINQILSNDGVILGTIAEPAQLSILERLSFQRKHHVPIKFRTAGQYDKLLAPLKPIAYASFPDPVRPGRFNSLIGYSGSNSQYPAWINKNLYFGKK